MRGRTASASFAWRIRASFGGILVGAARAAGPGRGGPVAIPRILCYHTSLMRVALTVLAVALCIPLGPAAGSAAREQPGPGLHFRAQEIRRDWDVVYALELVDMNADGRRDILAINPTQLAWYESPGWKPHVILDGATPADNVCLAAADLDGDGRPEVALGAAWNPRNTTGGGTLHLATRTTPDGRAPWRVRQIGAEPTLHRIRWADVEGDRQPELIVAPLHGRGTSPPAWEGPGARILLLRPARGEGAWPADVVDDSRHILHNFLTADLDGRRGEEIVTASREGVTLFTADQRKKTWQSTVIGEGAPGEVVLGRHGGRRVLATVEPWHGTSLVVYRDTGQVPWPRTVIEDAVLGGHALEWADLDGDGDDELVVGWRDGEVGLAVYEIGGDGERVSRQLVDPGGVAVEDLAVADLDADGRPDLVAGGRRTENIRIYWNEAAQ